METLILVIHVVVCVAIICMVLLQQGKGADTGASFGSGVSQTVFGSQGTASFLSKVTTVFAVVFFLTSSGLALYARQKASILGLEGVPKVSESIGNLGEKPEEKPEEKLESESEKNTTAAMEKEEEKNLNNTFQGDEVLDVPKTSDTKSKK